MKSEIQKPILSIETSGELCGACVFYNEKKYFELNVLEKNVHSEKLIEVVDYVLKTSRTSLKEIGSIAVSAGPGSFTGLRIGMSSAKGLALGANLPIIPVPTFEALALKINSILPYETRYVICNKVNGEEIYFGRFQSQEKNYKTLENIKVIRAENLKNNLQDSSLIFGNIKVEKEFEKIFRNISEPEASNIAQWAYLFGKDLLTFDYDFLEPNYLKNFIIR